MKFRFCIILIFIQIYGFAAEGNSEPDTLNYHLKVDLNTITDDKLKVIMTVPRVHSESIEFHMPKIVPGTYSISDFGRFLSHFEARDINGNELDVERLDSNRWKINDAGKLHEISYLVDDTFDGSKGQSVFEPGGTNIEEGKNVILNNFGFFGYLEGFKNRPYILNVQRPDEFYGASALHRLQSEKGTDIFYARDYFELHDSPIFYAKPDTTSLQLANTKVMISVYSPNAVITSKAVMDEVKDVLLGARDYLGGTLPVDNYAILIYALDRPSNSGGFGALEHSTSTLFVLPEAPMQYLGQTIRDVTAHEFFHIVTPLGLHSEEIGNFDFINPKMSQHLWLYEGTTEYKAHHAQLYAGLITLDEFLETMRAKMLAAQMYKADLSFTELSKKALDEEQSQYGNVYQKGALIGLALDLRLRDLSEGEYGMQDLMEDLEAEYGEQKPFKDDMLFDKITELTYPEIREFFRKYVEGSEPIPYSDLFEKVGIIYRDTMKSEIVSTGNVNFGFNPVTKKVKVFGVQNADDFGRDLGFMDGDALISWNGEEIVHEKLDETLENFKNNVNEGDKVTVLVEREDKKGNIKSKTLKAKAIKETENLVHYFKPMKELTERQEKIRNYWIGKNE